MFKLNLVTPEKKVAVDLEVEEVIVPGNRGELTILPGHAPIMTTLEPGPLKFKAKGKADFQTMSVSWGYCQVSTEAINVLAEHVVALEEVNTHTIPKEIEALEQKIANESLDDIDWEETQRNLKHLRSQLDLKK